MGNKVGMEINRAFDVLGLDRTASPKEAKKAYRKLVRLWHPDRFFDDPHQREKAGEKLKEVNLAYGEVVAFLSTNKAKAEKRDPWHQARSEPQTGRGPAGAMVVRPEGSVLSDLWRSVARAVEAIVSPQPPSGSSKRAGFDTRKPRQGRNMYRTSRKMRRRRARRPSPRSYQIGYFAKTRRSRTRIGAVGRVEPIERIRPISRISPIGGDE